MTADTLDEALKAYYEGQRLGPDAVARLLAVAGEDTAAAPPARPRRWLAAAALAAGLLLAGAGTVLLRRAPAPAADRAAGLEARLVAYEIAVHHLKDEPVEFAGEELASISRQMAALSFELLAPSRVDARSRPIGARYCSLGGQRAAQIKLRDPSGRILTLYETAAGERFRGLPSGEIDVPGVRVRLWQQDGLLLGLADSTDVPSLR